MDVGESISGVPESKEIDQFASLPLLRLGLSMPDVEIWNIEGDVTEPFHLNLTSKDGYDLRYRLRPMAHYLQGISDEDRRGRVREKVDELFKTSPNPLMVESFVIAAGGKSMDLVPMLTKQDARLWIQQSIPPYAPHFEDQLSQVLRRGGNSPHDEYVRNAFYYHGTRIEGAQIHMPLIVNDFGFVNLGHDVGHKIDFNKSISHTRHDLVNMSQMPEEDARKLAMEREHAMERVPSAIGLGTIRRVRKDLGLPPRNALAINVMNIGLQSYQREHDQYFQGSNAQFVKFADEFLQTRSETDIMSKSEVVAVEKEMRALLAASS